MNYKQHPLSAAFPAMQADEYQSFNFAGVSTPNVDGSGIFIVNTFPSKKYAGYVHYKVLVLANGYQIESRRPMKPAYLAAAINHILKPFNLTCASLSWTKSTAIPHDFDAAQEVDVSRNHVYFIAAGEFIKIGTTNGQPDARLKELQTGCPYKMELVACINGGIKEERDLHARFSAYRVRASNEWFRNEGLLKNFIEKVGAIA